TRSTRDWSSDVCSSDLGSFVFIPLGLTIAGPVADAVGVSTALWGASFVALVTVLVPLLSRDVRTLRRVEAPLELPPLETEPTVRSEERRVGKRVEQGGG